MKIYNFHRQAGKTTCAIRQLMNDEKAILIVANLMFKKNTLIMVAKICENDHAKYTETCKRVMTYSEYRTFIVGRRENYNIIIDELEIFLTNLFRANIKECYGTW